MVEQPLVERLVLGPDGCQTEIGIEEAAGDEAEPEREVRQLGKSPREFRIRDKAGWIDHDFALIDLRLKIVAKYFH